MYKDPYDILGVHRDATPEEVKKAYRELAKKYHPDNFSDPSMNELASEKMKEINEAYDAICHENSYTGGGGDPQNSIFRDIRILINNGRFSEAEIRLDALSTDKRGAEWCFLKGCVLAQRGWFLDAQKLFDNACNLDPSNQEYRNASENLKNRANSYNKGYKNSPYNTSYNPCCACDDLCTAIICTDCLCHCLGGDCF